MMAGTLGRYIVLLKKPKPSQKALDKGPISLTLTLYRCWAHYRAKQLLTHIDTYLPDAVGEDGLTDHQRDLGVDLDVSNGGNTAVDAHTWFV